MNRSLRHEHLLSVGHRPLRDQRSLCQHASNQPKFEAASVKRTDQCSMENSVDPGMVTLKGDALKPILTEAFQVKMDQIVGPSWLDEDCFDIIAKMPEGRPAIRDQRCFRLCWPKGSSSLCIKRFDSVPGTCSKLIRAARN